MPKSGPHRRRIWIQYANEALDIVEYLEFHLGILRTRSLKEWLPIRDAFIAERISPRLPTAAISSVKEHRARGDHTAIITATQSILAQGIGDLFQMPVIAPRPRLRDDHVVQALTQGRINDPQSRPLLS